MDATKLKIIKASEDKAQAMLTQAQIDAQAMLAQAKEDGARALEEGRSAVKKAYAESLERMRQAGEQEAKQILSQLANAEESIQKKATANMEKAKSFLVNQVRGLYGNR